ncbi:unnamed protein product [Caenorhabditis sp. 36 PRJEB53466]|nr:unnamed protein product [Caenorhabditis sp. 36 PRJEB53466]
MNSRTREIIINQITRKAHNAYFELLDESDTVSAVCPECSKRKGKFIGTTCGDHVPICKYCVYVMMLAAIREYQGGVLTASCPHCYALMHTLKRISSERPHSLKEIEGDENTPTPEVSRPAEITISISEYAASIYRESRGGRVNRAYDSSSSL